MCLVGRLGRRFVHVKLMVDESRQGHDLQGKSGIVRVRYPGGGERRGGGALTSLWCVLGFCTVFRLKDMTVRAGGDRSLITVISSGLRARASTLHQLTGWLMRSGRRNVHIQTGASVAIDGAAVSLRGVLMSSQQGPLIFRLRSRCSRKEVLVPNM